MAKKDYRSGLQSRLNDLEVKVEDLNDGSIVTSSLLLESLTVEDDAAAEGDILATVADADFKKGGVIEAATFRGNLTGNVTGNADTASEADHAAAADEATHAASADTATNADHATSADSATNADEATHAADADTATTAGSATEADHALASDVANKVRILVDPPSAGVTATLVLDASGFPDLDSTVVIDVGDGPVTWKFVAVVTNDYDVVRGLTADDAWGFLRDAITQEDLPGFGSNKPGFQYMAPIKQFTTAVHDTGADTLTLTSPVAGEAGNDCTVSVAGGAAQPFTGGEDPVPVPEEGLIYYFAGSLLVYGDGAWLSVPLVPWP